ncbi:MAG: hypothetical protein NTX14_02295 [Candidatus Nealsonbacteria bacterium]|nr:hypothetical protein [Candidatus Nealsonbacteria bacterium]
MAFLSLKTKTIGSDSLPVRIFSRVVLLFLVLATGFFFLRFVKAEPIEAESGTQKWKNFSENRFGFAMDYPSNWGIDHAYDRYAAGMLDIDLNNKKNGWNSECGPEYVDLRIFVGSEPGIGTKDSGAKRFQDKIGRAYAFAEWPLSRPSLSCGQGREVVCLHFCRNR